MSAADGQQGLGPSTNKLGASLLSLLWERQSSRTISYSFAVILAALAQASRHSLRSPTSMPLITYVPFLIASSAIGGLRPGLLCTLLCTLESAYFSIEPIGSWTIADPQYWIGLTVLAFSGGLTSLLFHWLQATYRELRSSSQEMNAIYGSAPVLLMVLDGNLQVKKTNQQALGVAGEVQSTLSGLTPGKALGCENATADPRGCGYGPECRSCVLRSAALDTVRNRTSHHGIEAWVSAAEPKCLLVATTPLDNNGARQGLLCAQDITARKKAEAELRQQRDLLIRQTRLINLSQDAIITVSPDRMIQSWNRGAEELYGRTEAEVKGHIIHEVLGTELSMRTAEIDKRLLREGRWQGELIQTRSDGRKITVESCQFLERYETGEAAGILEINRDITERKQAEERYQQLAEHRRMALEAAELGAWDYRLDTGEVFCDDRCRKMFGIPEDAHTHYDAAWARIHPDDRSAVEEAVKRVIEGSGTSPNEAEFRVVWPDGSQRWISSHGRVYFNGEGEKRRAIRITGISADVTDRKRVQAERRRALDDAENGRRLINAAFAAHTDGILVFDTNRKIVSTNGAATQFFGFEPAGMCLSQIITRLSIEGGVGASVTRRALDGETVINAEQVSGNRVLETSAAPMRDAEEGRILGAVTVTRDITDRKRTEQSLRHTVQLLESAVAEKTVLIKEVITA